MVGGAIEFEFRGPGKRSKQLSLLFENGRELGIGSGKIFNLFCDSPRRSTGKVVRERFLKFFSRDN